MAIADSFNLMDDDFFAVVMRDKAACSYTLSRLLDKKLNVIKVDTQYAIRASIQLTCEKSIMASAATSQSPIFANTG